MYYEKRIWVYVLELLLGVGLIVAVKLTAIDSIWGGMGGGLILNGELYTGNQFKAAEYGHMILDPEGPLCNCGQRGCLEAFSSKQGMSAYIRQQVSRGRKSAMAEAVTEGVFLLVLLYWVSYLILQRKY